MSTLDRERLSRWLRGAGGSQDLTRAVRTSDWSAEAWRHLGFDDRRALVEGLLQHVCDPRADEATLALVERVSRDVGFTSDEFEGLVAEVLGITAARLRAHAVLGLPLHVTPDEVKATHRTIAKALHPDRLQRADPEARQTAERLLGRVNRARAALLSPKEVVTSGPDDVPLEPDAAEADPVEPGPSLDDVPLELLAPEVPLSPAAREGDDVGLEPVTDSAVPEDDDPALEAPRIPRRATTPAAPSPRAAAPPPRRTDPARATRKRDDLDLGDPQFDEASGEPPTDADLTDLLEPG